MKRVLLVACAAVVVWAAARSTARAVDQETIDKAVDRGVAFIRGDGALTGLDEAIRPGANALVGLTLLECGTGADDPVVRIAAERCGRTLRRPTTKPIRSPFRSCSSTASAIRPTSRLSSR